MEFNEDVLNQIESISASGIASTGESVLRLVAEIRRLRAVVAQQAAEIEALRVELEAVRQALIIIGDGAHSLHYAGVPAGGQYALQELNRTAKDMLNRLNALDAKPDAAPAPVENAAAVIGTPDLTDDELEIAKAEMDAFYGRTEDDEPDYEAYRAAQEKAHWDMLDQMEDARELDEYFEEHGVEPGGTCPDCGRTDAGCICK